MCELDPDLIDDGDPVHGWFGLTYSNYLVLQRSLMEAMPVEWQRRMVACLREMDDAFDTSRIAGAFWIRAKNDQGRFVADPLTNYRRPDRALIESLRRRPADGETEGG